MRLLLLMAWEHTNAFVRETLARAKITRLAKKHCQRCAFLLEDLTASLRQVPPWKN